MGKPHEAAELRETAGAEQRIEIDRDIPLRGGVVEVANNAQFESVSHNSPLLRRKVEVLLQVIVRRVPLRRRSGIETMIPLCSGFDVDWRRRRIVPAEVTDRECPVINRARLQVRLLEHRPPPKEAQEWQDPLLPKCRAVQVGKLVSKVVVPVAEVPKALFEPLVEITREHSIQVPERSDRELESTAWFV